MQAAARASCANRPPLGPLHVITAVHLASDPTSADNSARMTLLHNELSAAKLHYAIVVGSISMESAVKYQIPTSVRWQTKVPELSDLT